MPAWQLDAIGTSWQVDTPEPLSADVTAEVLARIEQFDRAWSRFRPDSLVSAIAAEAGEWELPDEATDLLAFYDELHEATDGAVNPLIGRTLADLGYDAGYSLRPVPDPAPVPDWSSIRRMPGRLRTTAPVVIDVGAAGKGLLVDLVAGIIGRHVDELTVDASGDLLHRGVAPIRVALEHPDDPRRAVGVVELAPRRALAASATNRRAWGEGLHHVLDARTGRPTTDVVATWVVADSCMLADGLATAHFLAPADELMARWAHEFVRMYADGRIEWSPDLPGEVFV